MPERVTLQLRYVRLLEEASRVSGTNFRKPPCARPLCAHAGRQSLWTLTGPTPLAEELLQEGGGPLSHGEKVMLFVAWALWNGEGDLTLDELVNTLDGKNLELVGALLVALSGGSAAIDAWLDEHIR